MPVKKIFWENPYQTELTTVVTSVVENTITLQETIAYAFAGGQQSDTGWINDYPILNAEKKGKEIFYKIPKTHTLQVGSPVQLLIDWEKRYKIMKLHFAAELILELVNRYFNYPEKIGANITSEKARIDFIWEENIADIFPFLLDKFHTLIKNNHPIESAFSDITEEKRYWQISGFAKVACGGTHLKSTGEIGMIRLRRDRQGKNKERIEIYLTEEEIKNCINSV
jgi:alanyl-tRNA synthetase